MLGTLKSARFMQTIYSITLCLAVSACKQSGKQKSGIKTLDNVVSAEDAVSNHPCGISYDGSGAIPTVASLLAGFLNINSTGDPSLRNTIIGTLEAVPRPLLALYFQVFRGSIEIGDAASECKVAKFTNAERPLVSDNQRPTSCWLGSNGELKMVLNPEAVVIRSSLLRLFAYWHMEFFIDGLVRGDVPAPFKSDAWRNYAKGFRGESDNLAKALLADVSTEGLKVDKKLTDFHSNDPIRFANLIYANAVDSYYCSKSTRAAFKRQFPKTWTLFTDSNSTYAVARELGTFGSSF